LAKAGGESGRLRGARRGVVEDVVEDLVADQAGGSSDDDYEASREDCLISKRKRNPASLCEAQYTVLQDRALKAVRGAL
jgi:hypothetical protein